MISGENNIVYKMKELEQEMKNNGLWQKEPPEWVNYFEEKIIISGNDFAQWLQYVFIPNQRLQAERGQAVKGKKMIVPAALKFFGEDVQKGKLLQLLIEIDALS
ncbi:YqcC family protein [Ferruginibacter sp.]|uniref:YqcC family protein n=1 Tax=Ferruginibacter sp. TaxID=1940288 RepID=UPI0019BBB4B1|nr:YqcC family protein [Ferruginibacter sp.]MBC7628850.1 YqcC family protein [Ferruginibacter sp.]